MNTFWKIVTPLLLVSAIVAAANYTRFEDLIVKNTLSVGSNAAANSKAALDVSSTTKGFLPPRMTTTQQNNISSPTEGLMIYDNVLHRPAHYDGTSWLSIASLSGTETLTNKTINGSSNTITNVSLSTGVTGTLPVGNGGTGITSGTSGGVPYYSASNTIASSGALTANRIVLGGGAGAAPTVLGAGTTTTVLHGNAAGAPSFGAVALSTDVSGTLPIANGGTGETSATNAMNALVPTQSGNSGKILGTNGSVVSWVSPSAGSAGLWGTAQWASATTNTAWVGAGLGTSIATVANCGQPTVTGNVTSIGTTAPKINIGNTVAGHYTLVINTTVNCLNNSQLEVIDSSGNSWGIQGCGMTGSGAGYGAGQLGTLQFSYTYGSGVTGNTLELRATTGANNIYCAQVTSGGDAKMAVYYYPTL